MTRFSKGARAAAQRERRARGHGRRGFSNIVVVLVMWGWRLGVPIFAVAVGSMIATDLGSAWSARSGAGTHGTYTVRYEECDGSKRCVWRGDFVSDDGRIHRNNVGIGAGVAIDHVGQTERAVDTGNRINVYPPGGGWDWILIFVVVTLVAGLVVFWARSSVSDIREWMAERADAS